MNALTYIGPYRVGDTCRMRGECLRELYPDWNFTVIDIADAIESCPRLWRSVGWRFKIGPLISRLNADVLRHLPAERQRVIWVDKGVFLTPDTVRILRERADILVHYTPDPAFSYHRSRFFFRSISEYDFLITTKSYELADYIAAAGDEKKVLFATQGFQANLHRPVVDFSEKRGVVFIGHYEEERAGIIAALLRAGVDVTLAGIKWEKFIARHPSEHLHNLGRGVFGTDYVKAISSGLFGFGSISKWIPERHTTRTFEIPACGTALLTERNDEIATFFHDDEVIYYNGVDDLIEKVKYYSTHLDELRALTERGRKRVVTDGRDYRSIIRNLMERIVK